MKTKTILTMSLIAGVILLVTGTSITSLVRMAFADPNPNNNGQNYAPGQGKGGVHRNPSGDYPPPGQNPFGNPGQCQNTFDDHEICHQ